VLDTRVSCAKTADPIEMPFGRLTRVGPKKHVLNGTNPFTAARGDAAF